jgi:hypothetical protein
VTHVVVRGELSTWESFDMGIIRNVLLTHICIICDIMPSMSQLVYHHHHHHALSKVRTDFVRPSYCLPCWL